MSYRSSRAFTLIELTAGLVLLGLLLSSLFRFHYAFRRHVMPRAREIRVFREMQQCRDSLERELLYLKKTYPKAVCRIEKNSFSVAESDGRLLLSFDILNERADLSPAAEKELRPQTFLFSGFQAAMIFSPQGNSSSLNLEEVTSVRITFYKNGSDPLPLVISLP